MDTPKNMNQGGQATPPSAPKVSDHDKSNRMLFGILSYLGILVIVSLVAKKDDPFVKFHIKQGLVLLAIEVIIWILSSMLMIWSLWPLYRILNLGLLVLSILGIINVTQNKEKPLPLVRGLAKHFPI